MINAGRVAIVPKGEYVHGTQYTRLDAVRYNNGVYVAKKDNKSQYPTVEGDNDYWMYMVGTIPEPIGGRNYLRSPDNTHVITHDDDIIRNYNEMNGEYKLTVEKSGNQFCQFYMINAISNIENLKGKKCVISVDYMEWSNQNLIPRIFLQPTSGINNTTPDGYLIGDAKGIILRDDNSYVFPFTFPDTDAKGAYILFRFDQDNNKVNNGDIMILRGVKVALGDVYTDWTPNPEDTMVMPVEQRRNTFRGKNLGSVYTDEQKAQVAANTFNDLFIGDYWTINGMNYRITDINYWMNTGDTPCTTPHLVIMPDSQLYTGKMNSENTTAGGYVGSEMYKTGLNQAKEMINSAFGESYILNHREYLTNAVTDGHPSGGGWFNSTVELPNEPMMYGSYIFTPSSNGSTFVALYTMDKTQLALMRIYPSFINKYIDASWFRDPVSNDSFAYVVRSGYSSCGFASLDRDVRPVFGLKGTA